MTLAWVLVPLLLVQFSLAYPPSLAGPTIPPATLHRVFPAVSPVSYEIGKNHSGAGPYLTLVGDYFTEEYGAGTMRCKFHLENGSVTICAERISGGCTSTATDQTR
jgi:hypothetical protein